MTNPWKKAACSGGRWSEAQPLRGLVTAGDPSPKPGQRSGVNGPCPPRPAGGMVPEGIPLGRGLALPGRDGEWAKKRCPNAQLAQRQRLSRAPALPATCRDRTRACHATGDDLEAVGVAPHLHAM